MQIYIGIDWSENKHDVVFLNDVRAILAQMTIPHSVDGFIKLDTTRQALGVSPSEVLIGLETAHNLLIDFLWTRGYTQVFVLPPNVVKSSRGRYRQSGARTDESDALVIAHLLRTDSARFQPWHPDGLLTRQMRAKVSWLIHLTHGQVRLSNRLRAVLLRYYPAALQPFSDLTSQIELEFICAYPTPPAAAALTYAQFERFAQQRGYSHPRYLSKAFARLQAPLPPAMPETIQVYQEEAVQIAQLLLNTVHLRNVAQRELTELFQQHPDRVIFESLPGTGEFLAPGLLVKFGDDRQRFPSASSVQSLAGTCPVTDQSGKRKVIKFRQACDHEFRHIAQQWARLSLNESVWATVYFEQVRPHCDSLSHAYRCLANRWLAIAWRLWQTRKPYDETYHLQQRAQHSRPRS
jgi:transposase